MQRLISVSFFAYSCVVITYAQILYECNFDSAVIGAECLTEPMGLFGLLISDRIGTASNQAPVSPLSDVTSSLKPTTNGERCIIPHKVGSYAWDMYFCNNGYCPTSSNPNTACTPGKFGYRNIISAQLIVYTLNTDSGGINGTNQQCLTYYYYMPNIPGTQQNIKVRKQEPGGSSEQIDSVINSSYNGWIQREVSFSTTKPGYKINFDFQKTQGIGQITIAIDEISIRQGDCSTGPVTETTTTTSIITASTVITTTSIIPVTSAQTIVTTTTKPSTSSTATETSTKFASTITHMTSDISFQTTMTTSSVSSTITSVEVPTYTSKTSSLSTATTTTKFDKQPPEPNKSYIIVLAVVIPVVLIVSIGVVIWIMKFSSNMRIAPSESELNQMPPSQSS